MTGGARPSSVRLYLLLGAMLAIWSANFIFVKLALREFEPILAVCIRTILAGVFMWPAYLALRGRLEPAAERWRARDVPALVGVGALGVLGNQSLFILGMSRTSVAHGSLINSLSPMFVLLGAGLTGIERLTRRKVAGMLAAVAGVAVLQLSRSRTGASLRGDLMIVASTLSFAVFTVFGKRLVSTFGSITVNLFAFAGGAILVLPYTVWEVSRSDLAHVSIVAWTGLVYMALFSSVTGYMIYAYTLRHLPPSRVSSVTYLQPVLATLMAAVFLGEQPGAAFAAGAALVLGGVWVTERG